jgi:predicted dehydrogenase
MRLRVGIIGLGDNWQRRYRPALHALRDWFEVRSVYSPVTLLAEKAARRFRAEVSYGVQSLVRRPDIDAVLVLATDWLGVQPVLAACSAGKAVYSAIGCDLDLEQSAVLQQHIRQSGVAYMAEFARRHAPATVRLKELIATRLGKPQLLFCHHRAKGGKPKFRRQRGQSGDRTVYRLSQLVDWCCYVVGAAPRSVLGLEHHRAAKPPADRADRDSTRDYRLISLDFSSDGHPGSGPIAQVSYGSYLAADWPEAISFRPPAHLQVCCEHGVAFVDLPTTVVWFDEAGRHLESLEHERPMGEQMLLQFHRAVTSLVLKRDDLDDSCLLTRIMQTARRSACEGSWIELQDERRGHRLSPSTTPGDDR